MRYIVSLLMFCTIPFFVAAQNSRRERQEKKRDHINQMIRQEEEGVITYKKSFLFGPKLTNDGYGGFFEIGRASSVKKALLYQLEITERKSHKEEKLGSKYPYSTPLIYGKINFFYPVKLGVQQQFLLGNKSNKNGVAVSGNVGGGFVAALLRPYYVQVERNNDIEYIKYNSADSLDFMSNPIGGPSFGKGWSDMTVTPGVYGKAALRFDYGRFNEMITGIEVGVTAEYYTKGIPQMVYNKQKQFFFGAYFSLLFGKRK